MEKRVIKYLIAMVGAINITSICSAVQYVTSDDIITAELSSNAIIRMEPGFENDFLVLHCLIKKFQPKRLFEIGTCEGYGTLIMANACPSMHIVSLELPPHTPPYYIDAVNVGKRCTRPYQQVYGDSLSYNYEQHFPIDAWFIDAAHDYVHVKHETEQAVKSGARLIVYHDTDIEEVFKAIIDGLENTDYTIYRVSDTRMSYAIK